MSSPYQTKFTLRLVIDLPLCKIEEFNRKGLKDENAKATKPSNLLFFLRGSLCLLSSLYC
jgi:hypothetical protein